MFIIKNLENVEKYKDEYDKCTSQPFLQPRNKWEIIPPPPHSVSFSTYMY